jgi:hypothetical protein
MYPVAVSVKSLVFMSLPGVSHGKAHEAQAHHQPDVFIDSMQASPYLALCASNPGLANSTNAEPMQTGAI